MRDLGTLGGDNEATEARDINDAAQVVGSSPTAAGFTHALLWQSGAIQDLGTLGGDSSYSHGIDADGEVVGGSRTPNSPPNNAGHAFLWANGRIVDLNTVVTNLPGNVVLEGAQAITDDGSIVGTTCSGSASSGRRCPRARSCWFPTDRPGAQLTPRQTDRSVGRLSGACARPGTPSGTG